MALDRTGDEIVEPDPNAPVPHPKRCKDGWLGDAVPCLVCKPWLTPAVRRRALLDADELRATRPAEGETT